MKSLVSFIKESVNNISLNEMFSIIKRMNVSLTPMSEHSFDIANQQAIEWCEAFNALTDKYVAMTLREWLEQNNKKYSTVEDLKNGDIVVVGGDNEIYFDIKVAMSATNNKDIYGTPTAHSLVNFSHSKYNYYLCYTSDFSKVKIVNAIELKDYMINNEYDKFLPSIKNDRNTIIGVFKHGTIKSTLNIKNNDFDNVYDVDYVPSHIINSLSLV